MTTTLVAGSLMLRRPCGVGHAACKTAGVRRQRAPSQALRLVERAEALLARLVPHALTTRPAERNSTPSQVALAWLLAQKPFIVPIPGTRNVDHLTENLGAIRVQLTAADLQEMATGLEAFKVKGGRMNADQMLIVDRTV